MQFSSLGSLDEKWMAELSSSMSSGFSEDKTPLGIGEPLIVWPTVEDVRCSLEVLSSGLLVIIHYFLELYNNPILPNCKKSLSTLVYHLKFSFKWIIWHPLYLEPGWCFAILFTTKIFFWILWQIWIVIVFLLLQMNVEWSLIAFLLSVCIPFWFFKFALPFLCLLIEVCIAFICLLFSLGLCSWECYS